MNNNPQFVYLHGFNAAFDEQSAKAQVLSNLGRVKGFTYDTFNSYENIKADLISRMNPNQETVFVGVSLGGFWAAQLAHHFSKSSILINPCHKPSRYLRRHVDVLMTNYDTGEEKKLSKESLKSYGEQDVATVSYPIDPLILLDSGDDVIAIDSPGDVYGSLPCISFAGGSHRFEHMSDALIHIRNYLEKVLPS